MNSDQIKFLCIVEFMLLPITSVNWYNYGIGFNSAPEFMTVFLIIINIYFMQSVYGGTQHPMYDFGNPENNPYLKEK